MKFTLIEIITSIGILVCLAFWGVVIYCAAHFILKFWN